MFPPRQDWDEKSKGYRIALEEPLETTGESRGKQPHVGRVKGDHDLEVRF